MSDQKGKTAFQKIVDTHCVRILEDGSMVLKLDWVWCHEITTPNAIIDAKSRGCDVIFDPNKVKAMIDHVNPAKDTASAIQGKMVREWSKEHGIEFLDVGRNGVCHAIIPEKGWINPGQIGIMGDSHTCTHGAFCAFTAGVGTTEVENGLITGLWICPPQKVIRVEFTGELPVNVFAKDLILTLISQIGVKGATNAVLEFGGPVIDAMSMEARMTITNMAVEAGATSGMINSDIKTISYLFPSEVIEFEWLMQHNSDLDADYDQIITIDVSDMIPVITKGYSPGEVTSVASMIGAPVNQVYIGSCTNGRIEDLRIAAAVFMLTRGIVAEGVRCIVVPATQHIYEQALKEGLIGYFVRAGCFVSGPTCGACLGMSCGVIAPGEVCVSTTNRNFRGRMGEGGMVHLVSPATAAMTAINGMISSASTDLCKRFVSTINQAPPEAVILTDWESIPFQRPNYINLLSLFNSGEVKDFSGKAFYLPQANVDTDQIIPAKYLTETKKEVFGNHCLEDASMPFEDRKKIFTSQILVAGENFGCGSSREHAPWALEAAGIRCVIAPSFARIFENNMFANGLICITLPKDVIDSLFEARPRLESIDIDWEHGELNRTKQFSLSDYQKELIRNGGSVGYMINLAAELQQQGKLS
jgi:3-isopropylmalate/(R)-2-methylmalate dehydratase large subunit